MSIRQYAFPLSHFSIHFSMYRFLLQVLSFYAARRTSPRQPLNQPPKWIVDGVRDLSFPEFRLNYLTVSFLSGFRLPCLYRVTASFNTDYPDSKSDSCHNGCDFTRERTDWTYYYLPYYYYEFSVCLIALENTIKVLFEASSQHNFEN